MPLRFFYWNSYQILSRYKSIFILVKSTFKWTTGATLFPRMPAGSLFIITKIQGAWLSHDYGLWLETHHTVSHYSRAPRRTNKDGNKVCIFHHLINHTSEWNKQGTCPSKSNSIRSNSLFLLSLTNDIIGQCNMSVSRRHDVQVQDWTESWTWTSCCRDTDILHHVGHVSTVKAWPCV